MDDDTHGNQNSGADTGSHTTLADIAANARAYRQYLAANGCTYTPRNGDHITLNIDGDDCLYAVFGSDREHTYRGHGTCRVVAGAITFDTWRPEGGAPGHRSGSPDAHP